jgi:cytochrome P450
VTQTEPDTGSLQDLLDQFDLFEPGRERINDEVLAHARRSCPVARTTTPGQWLVTRYEDARQVLLDPETFSSSAVAPKPSPVPLPPLDSDPPLHTSLRRVLNPVFSRGYLRRFEPQMREVAAELVNQWAQRGSCELMQEFATPLVAGVLARIVFDEPDQNRTDAAVAAVTRNAVENTPESFFEIARMADDMVRSRPSSSAQRESVLTALADGQIDGGRRLTTEEQVAVVTTLFLAGLDTSRGSIGLMTAHLAAHPHAGFGLGIHRCLGAQLARIQIQVAFEEMLGQVTNIRLAPGAQLEYTAGITSGVESLPIEFDLRSET